MVQNMRSKWETADTAVKAGVLAGAAILAIVFVVKVLPYLVAAMGIGAFLAVLFLPYWAPTIIAFVRKHPSKGGILALNFFLGWSFIGWVLALVWALSDSTARAPQSVVVHTTVNPSISVNAAQPAPPSIAPQYQVGDVVNGHEFDGRQWNPLTPPASELSLGRE